MNFLMLHVLLGKKEKMLKEWETGKVDVPDEKLL